MTEERQQNQQLLESLRKIISDEKISQKELAKKLDYSQSSVNTYLNEKYDGNLNEFETVLARFLEQFKNKKAYKRVSLEFVQTSVAAKFLNIAQICQLNSEIGLCVGASGLGKTTAIKNYASTHSGVIVIDPDENITIRTLLRLIGKQLRLRMTNNISCQEFTEKLVDRLKDSEYLIIIDEAENIDSSCFRTLRKIHDHCDFTCGLLFVGTERLASNLARMQGEFSYVTNRLAYIENLDKLTLEDSQKLVSQIFQDCTPELHAIFYKLCKQNARLLFNLLKRTYDIFISSKGDLNAKMIEKAYKRIAL